MAEQTTIIGVSGVPISLVAQIDAAAKESNRDRSKFIVHLMRLAVNRKKKKSGAGGNGDGANQ